MFSSAWENLLKQLAQREQRLHAAGEIHRFHRDVAEALFRIQVNVSLSFNEPSLLTKTVVLGQKCSFID
jgi:spectrin beta